MAGQSVPHVHIHILPRHAHDFNPIDAVYTALDSANIASDYERRKVRAERESVGVDAEEGRKARSREVMKEEAEKLAKLFPEECRGVFEEW